MLEEGLREPSGVQYNHWTGRVAADDVDLHQLGTLLGVDEDEWWMILVDVYVSGGSQVIASYGVRRQDWDRDRLVPHANEHGRLELTKLTESCEEPADHLDTNPPGIPALPLTWATDLLAFGFKRFSMKLTCELPHLRDDVDFVCTESIVPDT